MTNRIIQRGKDLLIEADNGCNIEIVSREFDGIEYTSVEIIIPHMESLAGYKLFNYTHRGIEKAVQVDDGKGALFAVMKRKEEASQLK